MEPRFNVANCDLKNVGGLQLDAGLCAFLKCLQDSWRRLLSNKFALVIGRMVSAVPPTHKLISSAEFGQKRKQSYRERLPGSSHSASPLLSGMEAGRQTRCSGNRSTMFAGSMVRTQ